MTIWTNPSIIRLSSAIGPPWRDRSWTMPPKEKPGLGQGIMEWWNDGLIRSFNTRSLAEGEADYCWVSFLNPTYLASVCDHRKKIRSAFYSCPAVSHNSCAVGLLLGFVSQPNLPGWHAVSFFHRRDYLEIEFSK